jgi:hypothetical protein
LEEADYVVEARAGAVGTDRSDLLFGMPSVNVPTVPGLPMAMPSSIPEIPLAKTTKQKAVAKLAVFAYNRRTGRPVFQTGVDPAVSTARDSWLFGAGPFRKGTIYDHHQSLDSGVDIPIIGAREQAGDLDQTTLSVTSAAVFAEPTEEQTLSHIASPGDSEIADGRSGASSATSSSPSPQVGGQSTAVSAANSPTQLSNERVARLPPVDRSGVDAFEGATTGTAPGAGVQRAQFLEPVQRTSPPAKSRSDSAPKVVRTPAPQQEERSSWSIWRPGTWFGNSEE